MKKPRVHFVVLFTVLMVGMVILLSCSAYSRPLSPEPSFAYESSRQLSRPLDGDTAMRLFQLANHENRRLHWNECLSQKAYQRARYLVANRRFSHKDPHTGKNPVWEMVKSCCDFRYAGENLVKGYLPAEDLHDALMQSPSHRENILDRRYDRMGIGCFENICVEIFAGL